jgi:hypothetical protein
MILNHFYGWCINSSVSLIVQKLQGEQGDPMKNFQKLMGMETKTNDDPDED